MNWVTLSYTKTTAMIFYLSHINFPCIQIKSMKKYWGHLACCDSLKKVIHIRSKSREYNCIKIIDHFSMHASMRINACTCY